MKEYLTDVLNPENTKSQVEKEPPISQQKDWYKGLSFNALKTEVIMFSKGTSIVNYLPNRLII